MAGGDIHTARAVALLLEARHAGAMQGNSEPRGHPCWAPDGALTVPIWWLLSRSCLGTHPPHPGGRPEGLLQNAPWSGTGTSATVPPLHPQRGLSLGNFVLGKVKITCPFWELGFFWSLLVFFFPQFREAVFVPALFCIGKNKKKKTTNCPGCILPLFP